MVRYHTRRGQLFADYICQRERTEPAEPICVSIPGAGIDEAIGGLLVEAATPVTLEVALALQQELQSRLEEADRLRQQQVERGSLRSRTGETSLPPPRSRQPSCGRLAGGRLERQGDISTLPRHDILTLLPHMTEPYVLTCVQSVGCFLRPAYLSRFCGIYRKICGVQDTEQELELLQIAH